MKRPLIAAAFAVILLAAGGAAAPAATAAAQGPAVETLRPDTEDGAQWAASVVRLDELPNQGTGVVKLFGTSGGDPAMNGLYTYLAFYGSPPEGWTVFRIGDFLDYRILSSAPGRVSLQLQESTITEATGEIGGRTRRLVLRWTPGPDGTPPASVTVTPAR